jgi:hypothetical protein
MRNEKGQEVNRGEELVVDTEPWVELRALVVNEPVLAILKSPKAHDGALHVGEEALEPGAVLGLDLSAPVCLKARMFPGFEALHGLGKDFLVLEHHLEEAFAEELFEAREVDVLHGEVEAVFAEKAKGDRGMGVSMSHEKVPVGLRRDDHGGDCLRLACQERRTPPEVVAGGGVRDAAEVTVERTVGEEGFPQGDGDGKDDLAVRDPGQDAIDHALGPLDRSALSARRAETSGAAGKRDQFLLLLGALGIDAADAEKPEVRIPATKERFEEVFDPRVKRSVGVAVAIVPDAEELFEGIFDDLLEVVG